MKIHRLNHSIISSLSGLPVPVLTSSLLLFSAAANADAPAFWINEFHYDNSGADVGEFVEVVAPASFAELAAVRLTLYNGGDGRAYGSVHTLDTFDRGETRDGFTFYSKAIPGLQNGAPDGFALDLDGSLLDFVSYEGSFTATAGVASGATSRDVLVFEADTAPPGGSLGLTGAGARSGDFIWEALGEATPGQLNPGQTLLVPEPGPVSLMALFALGAIAKRLCRRSR
jgi:hypothetical protein